MYLSVGSNFFGERKGFRQFSERLDWFEAVFEKFPVVHHSKPKLSQSWQK
jgi:hypothetical protein